MTLFQINEVILYIYIYTYLLHLKTNTLPETNIAPKNGWLEHLVSFWDGLFSGAFAVSFRDGRST